MFTKLFSSITTSSIWNEDNNTRIVWITMLAMANKNGYVAASVGGLAHEARVTREDCEKALKVLTSPDEDSRSKEFDGRRVNIVDGGFELLNYAKYRAMRSEEERKEYMRNYMVEYRQTKNVNKNVNNVSECKPPLAKAEAEAEAEAEENKNTRNTKISFIKPSPSEVEVYGKEIGFSIDGEKFCDYYETAGWMRGNSKIKNWKACVRTWKNGKNKNHSIPEQKGPPTSAEVLEHMRAS